MNPQPKTPKVTLEEIAQRKEELLLEIQQQKQQIVTLAQEIIAPLTPSPTGNPFMKSIRTGMAVYDGVILGLKIMKKVRYLFNK